MTPREPRLTARPRPLPDTHAQLGAFDTEPDHEARLVEGILEAFVGPACVVDQRGRIVAANAEARNATRLREGDDFLARIVPAGSARESVALEMLRGRPVCFPGKEGTEWRTSPIRFPDERVAAVCVGEDAAPP